MLRRPKWFVTTTVLFLTEQISGSSFRKTVKQQQKRFVPRPFFFPANGKTTSSVAGCVVRISGSTVVCRDRFTLWLSTLECCRRRGREVSWQSFSPELESEPALRQEAVRIKAKCLCDQAKASGACVTWLATPGRKKPTRTSFFSFLFFFVRLSAKMNPWRWRKAVRKRAQKMQWPINIRELSADYSQFFGERKHGQAQAEHFLVCVSFQHVHWVLPESVKAYSFNLNHCLPWTISFIVLCVF